MDAPTFDAPTFEQFWTLYPKRVARKDAEKAWGQMTPAQQFAALASLPVHVRYWQAAGTEKEFLPYPASWLRGERWKDELEMPKPKNPDEEWWTTQAGIHRKALSLGMTAKPGEGYHELKVRILAKTRAA